MISRLSPRATVLAAAAALVMFAGAGTAAAAEPEAPPPTPAQEFFGQLPDAPADCHVHWDPIEDAIEAHVSEDQVPDWANEWFDAFDDWCEGDND